MYLQRFIAIHDQHPIHSLMRLAAFDEQNGGWPSPRKGPRACAGLAGVSHLGADQRMEDEIQSLAPAAGMSP